MDLQDLAAKARASRRFDVTLGPTDAPRTISLHTPTTHDVKIAGLRAGVNRADDAASMALLERALLLVAVTGWAGVVCADVAPNLKHGGDDALPWEAGATELLLDAQPDWAATLWAELLRRLAERNTVREGAAKN